MRLKSADVKSQLLTGWSILRCARYRCAREKMVRVVHTIKVPPPHSATVAVAVTVAKWVWTQLYRQDKRNVISAAAVY